MCASTCRGCREFGGRKITIRHLLHHTSGIRDWPNTLRLAGWRYDDVISFQQILKMARNQRDLNFDPGSKYMYSNTGYNLLAAIVEKVSDTTFAKWTHRHIFDPLGMKDTHFHDDHTRVVRRRATAYAGGEGYYAHAGKLKWTRVTNNLTAVGSSSLFTTIDDLGKWLAMFDEGEVLGKAAIANMQTPGKLNDGSKISYCYGIHKGVRRGLTHFSHSGSWAGFRTYMIRYPKIRLSIVVLANEAGVRPVTRCTEIAELFVSPEQEQKQKGSAFDSDQWNSSIGKARSKAKALAVNRLVGRYHSAELDTTYEIAKSDDGDRYEMRHFRNETVTLGATSEPLWFSGNKSWANRVKFVFGEGEGDGLATGFLVTSGRSWNQRFDRVPTKK